MAGARHYDRARVEARLLERSEELLRLCRRVDDIVFAAVDQKETGAVLVDRDVAERRGLEEELSARHWRGAEDVPMEAVDRREDPGPHGLFTSQSRDEILEQLRWGLTRFDGFVGINNHMGSKFTADANRMAPVMAELRARGLAFLDSRTSSASTGGQLAVAYGVPHAARDVFLDDDQTPAAIAKELARTEQMARQHGSAIAIGHPHDATIAALKSWLPQVEGKGLALVPVSAVVRHRMAEEAEPQR